MLKVEVQYVDFGNIEALPLASLREPTRAISHVNSLPFQVLHPTCLFVPCSLPPPSLPPLSDTPLHLSFRVSPNHSLPFQLPHPHVLLCLSLAALFLYGYPSLFVLTPPSLSLLTSTPLHLSYCVPSPPCSLHLQVPLPNCPFVSHLTVFSLRYPTLMPYCVPPLLLSSRTSTPPYLSFCFPPLTLSPDRSHSTCPIVSVCALSPPPLPLSFSLFSQVPLPYLPFVSHLAVFPFRNPTHTPSCVPSCSLSFRFLLIQLSFLYFCQPFVIVAVISFTLAYF